LSKMGFSVDWFTEGRPGKVDKDWNSVEIDVKQIRKVNP
ncbi:hypothetical protein ACSQ95_19375, partial [Salmonella enterica]